MPVFIVGLAAWQAAVFERKRGVSWIGREGGLAGDGQRYICKAGGTRAASNWQETMERSLRPASEKHSEDNEVGTPISKPSGAGSGFD